VAGLWPASRRRGRADVPDPGTQPRLRVISEQAYPSWEAVYRDNVGRIYALMFAKVGNRADAEDLTSEVFLTALRPLRTEASVAEVRAYLSAVARTTLAGYWRRTLGREVTVIDEERLPEQLAAPEPVPQRRQRELAEEILAMLPERYERVLRLRFLDGYSLADVSTALGISNGTARVLQFRALRRAAELAGRGQA
jgi:RNA polymerase sigma factor (sigma-70 family)